MTWRINSHNTFPRSLATIGNLLLGTPCYLSCCGMRCSRIMRTWFLMSCHWRILFQKVKRIATPLLCGKQCPTRAKYDRLGNLLHILLVIVLSLVKPCDPCWEIYHTFKINIKYTPHISATPTLGVRNNMFSIQPKMFYSYIGNRHKNIFVRINALSSCKYVSWKVSIVEKRQRLCKSYS